MEGVQILPSAQCRLSDPSHRHEFAHRLTNGVHHLHYVLYFIVQLGLSFLYTYIKMGRVHVILFSL